MVRNVRAVWLYYGIISGNLQLIPPGRRLIPLVNNDYSGLELYLSFVRVILNSGKTSIYDSDVRQRKD